MNIRTMSCTDVRAIYEMAISQPGFQTPEAGMPRFWSMEQLTRWVPSADDVLLVAEVDSRIVGFILSTLHRPTSKAKIEDHFVLPEYNGSGIGEKLLVEACNKLKKKGATMVTLFVHATDTHALNVYQRSGYKKGFDFSRFVITL